MPERVHTLRDIAFHITIAQSEILGKPLPEPLSDCGDPKIWGKVQLARKKAERESGPHWQKRGLPRIRGDIAYSPDYVAGILDALLDTATRTTKGRREYNSMYITPEVLRKAEEKLIY